MITFPLAPISGQVFRSSRRVRTAGGALVAADLLLVCIPGIWGIFDPAVRGREEGPGVGLMMAFAGLVFAFGAYIVAFVAVRVDTTGVHYHEFYFRKRFLPREEIVEVTVAPASWGAGKDVIYLIPRTGKAVELSLSAFRTRRGRAWLEATRQGMADALEGR